MNKPFVDVIRRVFDDDGRHFLEVGPWAEVPGLVELRTEKGESSAGYFGDITVAMSPEMAKALGVALIKSAEEIEVQK